MTMGNVKEQRRRRGNRNDDFKGVAKQSSSLTLIPSSSSSGVSYKPHTTLLVQFTEETPTWYECGRNTAGRDDTIYTHNSVSLDSNKKKQQQQSQQQQSQKQSDANNNSNNRNSRDVVLKYRQLADEIYSHEVSLSRQGNASNSVSEKDEKWVENTMRRGTLKDRIAAMSVVVNMDCMHKLYALDMLMDLAGCGVGSGSGNDGGGGGGAAPNSRVGQMASEALSDLFVNTLLPKDRKLISLDTRPLYLYEGSTDKTLSPRVLLLWRYEEMIKQRYSSYLSRYLGRAMAGEDEPSKKSALTTASSLLLQVPEGEEILLTMIVNKIGDPTRKIASAAGHQLRLILDEHPAMVSVVAREVQQLAHRPHLSPRALYSCVVFLNQLQLTKDPNDDNSSTEVDGVTTTRKSSSTTSLPASLINTYFHLFEMTVKKEEVNSKKNKMSDKKKSKNSTKKDSSSSSGAMKSRLLGALLTGVNRAHPYLPKKDEAMEQHIDALYRISHTAPPSASTQALMLLFQLAVGQVESNATTIITASDKKQDDNTVTTRKDRFYRALYSKLSDGEMFTGRQLTLFFNLLYKAMKYDTSPERISAFIKRLLHSVLHLSSSIVCGSLFLLSEIVRCHPELRYEVDTTTVASSGAVVTFDPTKREPRAAYSSSSKTASTKDLWELSLLAHHFHPSVTRFVAGSEGDIAYQGDPLKDFALQPFLDKFAFRNPKSIDKLTKQLKRGVSVAERKSGLSGVSALLPMNDPSYLESKNVSEEDSFFHKFFVERARRDGIKGIVRGAGASSNKDKDDSDLEDEALDAAEADELIDNFDGDTDSEEEAFVNQLAEKWMESSGNGKVNFDDEDPDMDGWSDYDDDEGEENVDDDDDDDSATPGIHDNEDSFMDDASSDDNDDGEAFDALGSGDDNDSGDDVDGEMPLSREAGSDDEFDLEEKPVSNDVKKQGKRKKPTSIYADAEEYEKQLEEEKRNQSYHDNEDSDSSSSEEKVKSNRKKKPKKR